MDKPSAPPGRPYTVWQSHWLRQSSHIHISVHASGHHPVRDPAAYGRPLSDASERPYRTHNPRLCLFFALVIFPRSSDLHSAQAAAPSVQRGLWPSTGLPQRHPERRAAQSQLHGAPSGLLRSQCHCCKCQQRHAALHAEQMRDGRSAAAERQPADSLHPKI